MRSNALSIALLLAFACGAPTAEMAVGTTSATATGTTSSDSAETTAADAAATSSHTTTTSSPTSGDATSSADTSGFITDHDGGTNIECDLWAQDCGDGEKCTVYASNGGMAWNATRCVPIAPDPQEAGEPCVVMDSPWSGLDDCDATSMCYYIDPRTLMGSCAAFCGGTEANGTCENTDEICPLGGDSWLPICQLACNPLLQGCPFGRACYPLFDEFVCEVDASNGEGTYGVACEFANACEPGLYCAYPDAVPDCQASGCCSPYCDLSQPDPNAQCPGLAAGQECVQWYEEGQAPEGLEDLGACAIPA